jgi:antitoxin VapB
MALNIKDVETDQLARRLATLTGESLTVAIKIAVRERIEREERIRGKASVEELLATVKRIAEAPNRDDRIGEEILVYDERGPPG